MKSDDYRKIVGQLMICGFYGTVPDDSVRKLIFDYHVGGIILFSRNIGKALDVLKLTNELQNMAKQAGHEQPLLICIDQENGIVRRLGPDATIFPGAMLLGATDHPLNAYEIGLATGRELKALGINWNLAPVADVNNNPFNPVIGVRSYGEDPHKVAAFAREAIRGMHEAGVITTLKHFPGHGDTSIDSHLDLPVVPFDMERLERVELVPYMELAKDYADTVMTAHICFPAIDGSGLPATLSPYIISGILREKIGFDGVVLTDCLEMNAVRKTVGTARGAVGAVKAGVDMVMVSHSCELQVETANSLFAAAKSGEISQELLLEAYERVRRLKKRYLSWDDIPSEYSNILDVVGCRRHRELARAIYRKGVTLYKNEGIIPLENVTTKKILVVYPAESGTMMVEDRPGSACTLGEMVEELCPAAEKLAVPLKPDDKDIATAVGLACRYDVVIVGTISAVQIPEQAELVRAIMGANKNVIVVALNSPYDITCFKEVKTYIAAYEHTPDAMYAAARLIFGLDEAIGKMPVTIP